MGFQEQGKKVWSVFGANSDSDICNCSLPDYEYCVSRALKGQAVALELTEDIECSSISHDSDI